MRNPHILAVEDDEDIRELLTYNLALEGYSVGVAKTGEAALASVLKNRPDLILLNIMLPGINGLDVCRTLKSDPATDSVRVIMVTAKGGESDIVTGLELGADDYITKPFSPKVVIARVRTVLRRSRQDAASNEEVVRIHDIVIHPGRHEVTSS